MNILITVKNAERSINNNNKKIMNTKHQKQPNTEGKKTLNLCSKSEKLSSLPRKKLPFLKFSISFSNSLIAMNKAYGH